MRTVWSVTGRAGHERPQDLSIDGVVEKLDVGIAEYGVGSADMKTEDLLVGAASNAITLVLERVSHDLRDKVSDPLQRRSHLRAVSLGEQ